MKRKFLLFTAVQGFFLVIFCLTTLLLAPSSGLQPFNSTKETIDINLNTEASVGQIKQIARDEGLNIAIYNQEKNEYYTYFSHTINPELVFGVSPNMFIYNEFNTKNCASTDMSKNCDITLSKPDKKDNVSIFTIDKLGADATASHLILYPDGIKSKDDNRNIFLTHYSGATFLVNINFADNVLELIIGLFIIINMLILLSIIQGLYKQGKATGIQKLFGRSSIEHCIIPLVSMITTVVSVLIILCFLIYYHFTFDWAYLSFIVFYCVLVGIVFISGITYHQVKINQQPINLLMKGMLGGKALMASYIMMGGILLLISGFLLPLTSNTTRQVMGEYHRFSTYKTELDQSGTIPLKESASTLLLQQDKTFVEKNNQLMSKFGNYLELKNKEQEVYMSTRQHNEPIIDETKVSFPVFEVNKNFVLNQIGQQFQTLDFTNENKIYIFSKDSNVQQAEIDSLRLNFSSFADEHPTEFEIIPYENNERHEYVETFVEGKQTTYVDVQMPLYLVRGGIENYNDGVFASSYGGGYYVSLKTAEARDLWAQVSNFLNETGTIDYYNEPTTLTTFQTELIAQYEILFFGTMTMATVGLIGGIALIYIFLQEYFRNKRKELVLSRIFGSNFLERYQIIFLSISLTFILSWSINTALQQEWEFINLALVLASFIIMNGAVYLQIKKLEKAAMNIVIKE